jgi:nucleoside-diphosphate-sugar epimerase
MNFASDVAAAFVLGATQTPDGAQTFSLAGDVSSTKQIIDAIRAVVPDAQITDSGEPLPLAPVLDEGALWTTFPTLPNTPLAEGTRRTIEFYRALAQHA